MRADDIIFRYGGEEFVLFFPDSHSKDMISRVDNLREGLSKNPVCMKVDGELKTASVTASFGIAEYPRDSKNIQGLIEKADKAAYYSKRTGRNRVTLYTKDLNMTEGE